MENKDILAKDNPPVKETVGEESDRSLLGRLSDYLTGKTHDQINEEKKDNKQVEFPGFFDFVSRKWSDKEKQSETGDEETGEKKSMGFFKKLGLIYNSYQKAKEEEVEKLNVYESINQGSRFSKEFVVLLYTSCFIATMGLFQDSAAVIIGAMIIAPLMMPILGFSLGTIWGDKGLLIRSILTLLIGTASVLAISSSLTMLVPGVELNSQINARINPNLYDIIIALASGVVGAYAYVNPRTSSTISGVAISVALMPPLCTIGITLGQWNLQAATGATLLYLTNLVSIAFAASVVFWRLRIHPVTESQDKVKVRAKRKLFITAIMLIMISVPLGYFMKETYIIKKKQSQVRKLFHDSFRNVTILSLDIKKYPVGHKVKAVLVVGESYDGSLTRKVKSKIRSLFPMENVSINLVTLSETPKK